MQKAIPPLMDPIPYVIAGEFVSVPRGCLAVSLAPFPCSLVRTLPEITHRVFFEIELSGKRVGKIVFGLFGKTTPKTVDNFLGLAKCDRGLAKRSGKKLCYKGTTFHRIIPDFFIQGGDFTHGTGVGGESIYGQPFEDENFEVNHNRPHMLSMSNCGERDCNGSQFIITLAKTQWLNDKHVAFGVVLEGHELLDQIHGGFLRPRARGRGQDGGWVGRCLRTLARDGRATDP